MKNILIALFTFFACSLSAEPWQRVGDEIDYVGSTLKGFGAATSQVRSADSPGHALFGAAVMNYGSSEWVARSKEVIAQLEKALTADGWTFGPHAGSDPHDGFNVAQIMIQANRGKESLQLLLSIFQKKTGSVDICYYQRRE